MQTDIQLFPDEKLIREVHPSRLSFIRIYMPGALLILWSFIYLYFLTTSLWRRTVSHVLDTPLLIPFLTGGSNDAALLFWIAVSFLLALISLLLTRRHRHWLIFAGLMLLIIAAVLAVHAVSFFRNNTEYFLFSLTLISGAVAFFLADLYRRSFRYYITSFRIAMVRRFLTYNELYIRYENLADVDVHLSILGRLFSFGDVVPITAAGVGAGANYTGKEGPGGSIRMKATDIPRALPSECFFGVKRPYVIRNEIAEYMQKSSSAYELRQIQQELSTQRR